MVRWSSVRGVVVLTVVAALMSAWSPVASARPRDRRETVTQVYLPYDDGVGTGTAALCSLFGVDTIVSACATEGTYVQGSQSVMFPKPSWARSAFVTVRDETPGPQEAILYVTHWGTESSVHCSHKGLSVPGPGTQKKVALRARPGDLRVQPLVGYYNPSGAPCPIPFESLPTTGTITVTFSSGVV